MADPDDSEKEEDEAKGDDEYYEKVEPDDGHYEGDELRDNEEGDGMGMSSLKPSPQQPAAGPRGSRGT